MPVEQLQRHEAQELLVLGAERAHPRQRLAPLPHRGKMLRLDHAAADEQQQQRRNDPDEEYPAPAPAADQVVDLSRRSGVPNPPPVIMIPRSGAVRLGEGLGDATGCRR